jgi:dinuclear metal center YbgI/SA1388 family protein
MEEFAPMEYVEDFDNCGLLVGEDDQSVNTILVALESTMDIIDYAINNKIDMIITHHPVLFSKYNKVNNKTLDGRKIIKLIKNNISVYSAHSNLDKTTNGINDLLADMVGLTNVKTFGNITQEDLYKVVVFIPKENAKSVTDAMCSAGAGYIGNYSDCTFSTDGVGTFKPLEGSNPYIGKVNEVENVEEVRLETIVPKSKLNRVINEMINNHPYEEVAYDIYKTERKINPVSFGRVGELEEEMTLINYAKKVKKVLNLSNIHLIGEDNKIIKKVALCSGSGMSEFENAVKEGADVFITGDVKYHQAIYAKEIGVGIIDATHYGTENIIVDSLGDWLSNRLNGCAKVVKDTVLKNPIKTI